MSRITIPTIKSATSTTADTFNCGSGANVDIPPVE